MDPEQNLAAIPRLVIAGTHSGCGKTTVARGLMNAFRKRGLHVQPFKVGPDFIDPGYHTVICGRVSRNLDPFMMGEEGVLETFLKASRGADVAVIEGAMGMFDGLDGTGISSTAHVARILGSPVVLVTDVRGMSRSVHALIQGFTGFDREINVPGVIFNRVGSERHRRQIERELAARALGFIPRDPALLVESRHLGLKMAFEQEAGTTATEIVGESCDLDGILHIAGLAPLLPEPPLSPEAGEGSVRIGVASDPAFCFYYQDNLDRLRASGATLVFFSPLADRLPAADGYYFGGGYPELHAAGLEGSACRHQLRDAADRGIPVFGECGGMMFLAETLSTAGHEYRMAGILPADSVMTGTIQALGYSLGSWESGPEMACPGTSIRGHEFHYSYTDASRDARFSVVLARGKGIRDGRDGLYSGQAVGTYTHTYFSPSFAAAFARAAGHRPAG
jgi:cobyrinic acid a,c-diamide synthase